MLFLAISLLAFSAYCDGNSDSTTVIGKLWLEISYTNPSHYSSTGRCDVFARTCDVYFVICVRTADVMNSTECDVAKKKTPVIGPHSKIELVGQEVIELPLSNIPKSIKIDIQAWDSDLTSSDDHISTFTSAVTSLSSRHGFLLLTPAEVQRTSYNADVKIVASIKLLCSLHHYGEQCETYCKTDHLTFYCGEHGERKCLPGWYGEFCHRADMCLLAPCAPYAHCINNDSEEGRTCYCNDGSGPECYQLEDQCNPSPCQNKGICTKTGPHLEQFVCECKEPWYGPTCDQRYSKCTFQKEALLSFENSSTEVCLNGGLCQDDPVEFTYTCLCPLGWKGQICEKPDYTAAIVAPIVILVVLISVLTLLCLLWRTRRLSKSGRPSILIIRDHQPTGNVDGIEGIEAISNDIYNDSPLKATRVELLSEEDEYATLDEAPKPHSIRQSYNEVVNYASLLWNNASKSLKKDAARGKPKVQAPPEVPPRLEFNELTAPLIRSTRSKKECQPPFCDRPSRSVYERSKDDDRRTPLPFKDTNVKSSAKMRAQTSI